MAGLHPPVEIHQTRSRRKFLPVDWRNIVRVAEQLQFVEGQFELVVVEEFAIALKGSAIAPRAEWREKIASRGLKVSADSGPQKFKISPRGHEVRPTLN
jgi:hypothetical protein